MTTTTWILIVAVAFVIGAAAAWFLLLRRRSEHLRDRFGPEYERAVHRTGNARKAERELDRLEKRVEDLQIHPLPAAEQTRFAESWREVQSHFVDEPARAVVEADDLVGEVMERQGYPIGDFEQRSADVSVDHPHVVSNYRVAHAIASRSQQGGASTEDLRQAMVHYRALFEDLLDGPRGDGDGTRDNRVNARTTHR